MGQFKRQIAKCSVLVLAISISLVAEANIRNFIPLDACATLLGAKTRQRMELSAYDEYRHPKTHYYFKYMPAEVARWMYSDKTQDVTKYLDADQRALRTLKVEAGIMMGPVGVLSPGKTSVYDYVMLPDGQIILNLDPVTGKPAEGGHPYTAGGLAVAAAGEISIRDGLARLVNDHTGHYQLELEFLGQFYYQLKALGVDVGQIQFASFHARRERVLARIPGFTVESLEVLARSNRRVLDSGLYINGPRGLQIDNSHGILN